MYSIMVPSEEYIGNRTDEIRKNSEIAAAYVVFLSGTAANSTHTLFFKRLN